jgi:hypothetical protein
VKNLNGKNRLSHDGDFLSDTARIVERYTFVDAEHMNYEATIDAGFARQSTRPVMATASFVTAIAAVRRTRPRSRNPRRVRQDLG